MTHTDSQSYDIGINVIAERSLPDLNRLLSLITPSMSPLPQWKHWRDIMINGNIVITCIDHHDHIIGMTTLVPIVKPTGMIALVCDTAILHHHPYDMIYNNLIAAATHAAKKLKISTVWIPPNGDCPNG